MKHLLMRCSLVYALLLLCVVPAVAATSYSHLYISISDALINAKQDNTVDVHEAITQFERDWAAIDSKEKAEQQAVDEALQQVKEAEDATAQVAALQQLTASLRALELKENPVDESAQRQAFAEKIKPIMQNFEDALATNDVAIIHDEYNAFNIKWNKYERPVREQSMAMYGAIETQIAFIRMSLAAETVDLPTVQHQYATLKQAIDDFIAGKETAQVVEGDFSLATLTDYIDEALAHIDAQRYDEAAAQMQQFIVIWPQVEQEISTRNGSLYTKIESETPILASNLLKSNVDDEKIRQTLQQFKTEIELLQADTHYSFWDSALILLREGLEALLIMIALVAFLKKSGQQSMQKWIYIGAGVGIVLSIVAAVLMSTLLNTASVDSNRELLEGYIGLIAAVMMLGVGIWLHNKSSVQSWNRYISTQINHAISTGSVLSMAMISLLSVFREGAETIVFYVGIMPKMDMSQFLLGIVVALVILVVVAFVLMKISSEVPVHKFFAVATLLIYVLTFKIIGDSLHTLQLLGKLDTTVVDGLPIISAIAFYPTVETMIGQAFLVVLIIVAEMYKRTRA